jgi:3-carboxy-cis,cis-muconate cycloisomerase
VRQDELFGELYGTTAMRVVFSARTRVTKMLAFEVALARAEASAGVVSRAAADAIAAAADPDRIDLAALAAQAEVIGYPVVPLTKQLAALAGDAGGSAVHWGATTQDVLDTATVLQLRDAVALLDADLAATIAALAARARRHRDDVMAGRTHLQHALPVTFGYVCAIWLAPLIAGRVRLREAAARARTVQFGGAVGTLASLGDRARQVTVALAGELDLAVPDAPWHVDRSRFVELAAAVASLCGSLGTMATDVMLLMQTEVAEVFEPHAPGRGGSSAMPHKRNPIACEYVLAATRGVDALLPALFAAMPGDHQRSTGPWQTEEIALPQLVVLASAAFAQSRTLAEGMTGDTVRMRSNLDLTGGLILSEAVAMALAERIGSGPAHAAVERAASRALDAGTSFLDALVAERDVAAHLDRAALERLLDPAGYVGEAGAVVDRVLATLERDSGR